MEMVTVTGTFIKADTTPDEGTVAFEPYIAAVETELPPAIVTQATVLATLDAAGSFTVTLIASDDPAWSIIGMMPYRVTIRTTGLYATRTVVFPGPGPWDLAEVADADLPEGVVAVPVRGEPGPVGVDEVTASASLLGPGVPPTATATLTDVGGERVLALEFGIPAGEPGVAEVTQAEFDALQGEIGPASAVTAHTSLVAWLGDVDSRVASVEGTAVAVTASQTLPVDNYSNGFIRLQCGSLSASTKVAVALATTPGPGGAVYPSAADIPGGSAVWADFGGSLGKVRTAAGADVLGSTLKEWLRKQSVLTVHKDGSDPAHPVLVVDLVENPTPAGSSLTLRALADVDVSSTSSSAGIGSNLLWNGSKWNAGPVALTAATVASLPTAGNWFGRQAYVSAVGWWGWWNGTKWVTDARSDTGWVPVTQWDAAGVVSGVALGSSCAPIAGKVGGVWLRRTVDALEVQVSRVQVTTPADSFVRLWDESFLLPEGWRTSGYGTALLHAWAQTRTYLTFAAATTHPLIGGSLNPSTAPGCVARFSAAGVAWPTSLVIS